MGGCSQNQPLSSPEGWHAWREGAVTSQCHEKTWSWRARCAWQLLRPAAATSDFRWWESSVGSRPPSFVAGKCSTSTGSEVSAVAALP